MPSNCYEMMAIRTRISFLSYRNTFFYSCSHTYAQIGWIGLKGASKSDMRTIRHTNRLKWIHFGRDGMHRPIWIWVKFLERKFNSSYLPFPFQTKQYGFDSHGVRFNVFCLRLLLLLLSLPTFFCMSFYTSPTIQYLVIKVQVIDVEWRRRRIQ